MTTKKDLLRDALYEVINSFNPEYIAQADDASWQIEDLLNSIETFETECEEEDPQREAIDEIVRTNCQGLNLA